MRFSTKRCVTNPRTLLLVGAAALAIPSAVAAQDAAAEDTSVEAADQALDVNVIIVTATKREQTLQEIPVAVSVTSAETIERNQVRDLKDLQTLVPSLKVNQLQSSANTNFLIRGFGNGANNAGIEPSVGVFVDGVYRSRTASQITDLPDVQRIEVLRGPQSTLFGKNASAGVISIVTKKPQFDFGGAVEASYGNYDAIIGKGYVTGPITDSVAFSLAGGLNKRDGYLHDLGTGNRSNERDRWFTRGQLLFDNGGPLSVRVIGDYDKIDEICCGVVNLQRSAASNAILALGGQMSDPNHPYADVIYSNFDSSNKIKNWGFSGQIDYELGDWTVTSISAYRDSRAITNQDSDFTSADLIGRKFDDVGLNTFTQELRLSGKIGDRIDILVGGFYFNEDIKQHNEIYFGNDFREYANLLIGGPVTRPPNDLAVDQLEGTISALTGQNFINKFFMPGQGLTEAYRMKDEAFSLFGQADFEVMDGLTLTLGGNYTDDKKHIRTNVVSSDVFSGLDMQQIGQTALYVQALQSGTMTPAQALAFAQLNAPLTQAQAAADTNPLTVGNPLLALRPLQFLPPFLNVPNAVEPARTHDNKFSWTARLAYDVAPSLNVYVSYATGFKASSFNLSRDSRPLASDYPAIVAARLNTPNLTTGSRYAGPETTKVIEMGLKGNWDIFSANLTIFDQKIDGFQSNIFTGTGFALANAGKQKTFGIEFDSVTRVSQEFSVMTAFTYLKPKYDSFIGSAIGDLSGRTVEGISQLTASFGGQYDREINSAGDRIIANANFYYEAPVQTQDGLPGFMSGGQAAAIAAARPFRREVNDLTASLTYAFGMGLELSVWGRNLLDDRTITTIFDTTAQSRSISGYTNQPRTYGASAKFKF